MNLYEHAQQLLDFLSIEDEFDPQVAKDQLEALEGEFDDKAIKCGYAIKEMNKDVKAIEAEIKSLAKKAEAVNARLDWLKSYVKSQLTDTGKERIETPALTVRLQRNLSLIHI